MFSHLTLIMLPCCMISDTGRAEWGNFYWAFGVPPPPSALPLLHHPAVAFPSHPFSFLPEPSHLQRSRNLLPCCRLPTRQFTCSPDEAGAHRRRRVPRLHGELESLSWTNHASWICKTGRITDDDVLWTRKKKGNVLRFCFLISLENKGMLFTTDFFLVSDMMVLNCLWKIITNNWKILLSEQFTWDCPINIFCLLYD